MFKFLIIMQNEMSKCAIFLSFIINDNLSMNLFLFVILGFNKPFRVEIWNLSVWGKFSEHFCAFSLCRPSNPGLKKKVTLKIV